MMCIHTTDVQRNFVQRAKKFIYAMIVFLCMSWHVNAAGVWNPLTNKAPDDIYRIMLLSDGNVFAQNSNADCFLLKPNASGSYVDGTWSRIAPMIDTRLYYASQLLKNGRLLVAGGEYGTGHDNAEVYDPVTNTWAATPSAGVGFSDAMSMTLPNGNVLVAPVLTGTGNINITQTVVYDIINNTWSNGPPTFGRQNEVTWVKLPDGSIILPDIDNKSSERFIPSLNQWVKDGSVPVAMFDKKSLETGAGLLLPNGNAFFLGYKKTAMYKPSGSNAPGIWTEGPDIPDNLNCGDTPAAMLVNGRILVAAATKRLDGTTRFFEYDYLTNAFIAVDGPTGPSYAKPTYLVTFLTLPDGSVLMSSATPQLYHYVPNGSPLPEGKPVIASISHNNDGTYHLTGTLLNGISEGASYGDDVQVATNFPIVRLTDGSSIYYARTYNWSSTGVMTGSEMLSTEFALPVSIPNGTYSVEVVANGIASDAMTVTVPFNANNAAPTIQIGAMASVSQQSVKKVNLSVVGADSDSTGESNLSYTWRMSAGPDNAAAPSFTINGTNAAKLTTATVLVEGSYTFDVTVTDSSGASVSTSTSVMLDDVAPNIVSPLNRTTPIYSFINYTIDLQDSGFGHTSISTSVLPDGLNLFGKSISGRPRTVGHFNITLTATNTKGSDIKQFVLDVTDPVSNASKDTDGDGFPDELETYLSTNPLNSNSTPFAGSQANPVSMTVDKVQIKTDFRRFNHDTMLLTGSLTVPNGLNVTGLPVIVDVGGVMRTFTLNSKGSDTSKRDQHFKFASKNVGGHLGFSMSLNTTAPTSFSAQLEDEGLVNDDVKLTVSIPIVVLFNGTYYSTTVTQPYVGKSGSMGISKK